jgi:hypothetical protein
MKIKQIKGPASPEQIKAADSTKPIEASASTEKNQLGHDKAATGGGDGQKQPEILRTLDPEYFPPLVSSNLDLYRPFEEMEGYVILHGEEGDEVIYYGEEED